MIHMDSDPPRFCWACFGLLQATVGALRLTSGSAQRGYAWLGVRRFVAELFGLVRCVCVLVCGMRIG